MFRTVLVDKDLPRSLDGFNGVFMDGLHLSRNFGLFFCIGAILLLIFSLVKFKMIAPSIVLAALAIGGFYLFNKANKTAKEREYLYLNGESITATVKDHGRQFNMFKSDRDYTILVQPIGSKKSIKLTHKSKALWTDSPVGSEIIGFHKDGQYFFGEEIECQFKFPNN